MMEERNAALVPVDLYKKLHQEMSVAGNPMLVFRAYSENVAIAGICIALHGKDGTYLLGWNSERGRHLSATYLLLWHAILHLRDQGMTGFDLGGLDEENTPGISKFKKGIGGEIYSNIGNGLVF